jgi:hypothetical protein
MKPYLKGFHLLLETWRGERDSERWKARTQESESEDDDPPHLDMGEVKRMLLTEVTTGRTNEWSGLPAGFNMAVPLFEEDLKALIALTEGARLAKRCMWSQQTLMAYYGFGDALSLGFGAIVEHPDGLHGKFRLWGRDEEDQSLNYQELCNLMETVEEEACSGCLTDGNCGSLLIT